MLTKDNNKSLFKNIIDHKDCISQMDSLYQKLKDKEKDFIVLNKKYDNIHNDNILLKKQINLKNEKVDFFGNQNKNKFIDDDLMLIDIDIFEYESEYTLKNKVIYYENQLNILNTFFSNNNINGLKELQKIISNSVFNKNINLNEKYDNIFTILNNSEIKIKSQKLKINELFNEYKNINSRINIIKSKISKLKPGTTIKINGIKKVFKRKNEFVNNIKKMEEEFNDYCNNQISWARSIIGDNYSDNEIIKLLDIYNKINKDVTKDSSDSECELDTIINKYNMKSKKIEEYKFLSELGNSFINNNINDKSQIKNFIKNNKEIIYSYDTKDKINRFISTCKRIHILSHKISIDCIVKNKYQTNIRDMTNIQFDNLLKLLEKKNKNE